VVLIQNMKHMAVMRTLLNFIDTHFFIAKFIYAGLAHCLRYLYFHDVWGSQVTVIFPPFISSCSVHRVPERILTTATDIA
jgi:hypothetical protein